MAIVLGGNCPGVIALGGDFPGGGNCPGGSCPGSKCPGGTGSKHAQWLL